MLGPSSGVELTSERNIPRPTHVILAPPAELTNNWFSWLEADLLASMGLSEVDNHRPWCLLVKIVQL